MLISAFNEELFLEKSLRSIAQSTYPEERLEILVGSDASTDSTNAILQRLQGEIPNLKPFLFTHRQGKPAVLNHLVEQSTGEILVFMDADTVIAPGTIAALVHSLSPDPVGCADAALQIAERQHLEQKYYNFDRWLKSLESQLGVVPSLYGPCYAMKRFLFTPFPTNRLVMDDVYRSLMTLAQGKQICHASEAYATELAPRNLAAEFRRRIRYSAGGLQAIRLFLEHRRPLPFLAWYALLSHKFLRWINLGVFLLLFAFALSLSATSSFYTTIAYVQLAGVTIAAVGGLTYWLFRFKIPICYHLFYFFAMAMGLFIGVFQALRPTPPFWRPPQRVQAESNRSATAAM